MNQPDEHAIVGEIDAFLRRQFPATTRAGINPTADLFEAGIIDSVGVTETLAHIETTYGVHVPDEVLLSARFTTVAGIARVISDLRTARTP